MSNYGREVRYEESINPDNLNFQKVLYYIYQGIFVVNMAVFVISLILGLTLYLPFLIVAIFFGLTSFLLWYLKTKIYYCVDCIFVSGSTRLVKVVNYKRRKKIIIFEAEEVQTVGKAGSDTYNEIIERNKVKKVYATPNKYAENAFYVYLIQGGVKYLVVMDCTEEYLKNLIVFTGKKVIEKDYK